jgi:Peroxiredoxin
VTENVRLAPGDPAPGFTLPDADGNAVSLSDFRGRSLVIYCYPAASTPGCTKQACDFRDNLAELDRAGSPSSASRRTSPRSSRRSATPGD